MARVTCPCAFRCAGSRKTGVAVLGRGNLPVNFRRNWLLLHVHVHFDCAGSHKPCVAVLGRGIFLVNFRVKFPRQSVHAEGFVL